MIRIAFLLLFSLSLSALNYPKPYHDKASKLFDARVQLEPLVFEPKFQQLVHSYQRHSDKVLGHFLPLNKKSTPAQVKAYKLALEGLQKEYDALMLYLHQRLNSVMAANDYPIFLVIINAQNEADYKDPYQREKIYTYYHANRDQNISTYLDDRIKAEWNTIAPYYPKMHTNYAGLPNAYYREVTLINIPRSPYGAKIKSFFNYHRVKYRELDYSNDPEAKILFEKYKGKHIPMVIINNRVVEGYNEVEMDRLLRR